MPSEGLNQQRSNSPFFLGQRPRDTQDSLSGENPDHLSREEFSARLNQIFQEVPKKLTQARVEIDHHLGAPTEQKPQE